MPGRERSSTRIASLKPSPSSPSRFSAGTRQSVKKHLAGRRALDPHLRLDPADLEAGRVRLDDERRDALVAGVGVGLREADVEVRDAGVRDEPLRAVRGRTSPSRRASVRIAAAVRARAGSVSAYAASHSPLASRGRKRCFCSSVPASLIPSDAELLDGEDQAARRADLRHLLDRDERQQRAGAGAAVLLVEHGARRGSFSRKSSTTSHGNSAGLSISAARGRDPLARERADEVADLALLGGQRVARHGRSLFRRLVHRSWQTASTLLPSGSSTIRAVVARVVRTAARPARRWMRKPASIAGSPECVDGRVAARRGERDVDRSR